MSFKSWMPRYRVMTAEPGPLDVFVVTFLNGKRATIDDVGDYEAVVAKARAFVEERPCQIKVLPMSGIEIRNVLGVEPDSPPTPFAPEMQKALIARCMQIARESNDEDARRDAFDLLTEFGAIQS